LRLLFFFMLRRPTSPPLFPYTTLFRSGRTDDPRAHRPAGRCADGVGCSTHTPPQRTPRWGGVMYAGWLKSVLLSLARLHSLRDRSEEHTSELQSLTNLVCRLLLEKKKT